MLPPMKTNSLASSGNSGSFRGALGGRCRVGRLAHHTNQKMGSIFIGGLSGRSPLRQRGGDEGLVPPAIVPGAGVGHFSVALLPLLRFFASANQRKRSAGHYRDVGASNDFKQAESVRHLFVAPLISTDHRDPKHLDLRRLDHYEESLQITATGAGAILVNDDLAARLG